MSPKKKATYLVTFHYTETQTGYLTVQADTPKEAENLANRLSDPNIAWVDDRENNTYVDSVLELIDQER